MWQSCLIATFGLLQLLLHRYRTASLLLLIAGGWLYLCATPAFVGMLREGLESHYPFAVASTYPVADAIVVFGGDGVPNPENDWQVEADKISRNRLGFAYLLYRAERAPILVLSANKGGAVKMARILEMKGLPAASLKVESQADSTYENALYTARIIKREKYGRVLLVTSRYHMPRALSAFRKQGIDAMPAPSQPRLEPGLEGSLWLPCRATLSLSRIYLHEYLGSWAYALRGKT